MSADGDVIRAALDYLWSYAGGPPIEAEGQRSDAVVALARLEAAAESAYSVARMFDAAEENCRDAEANYLREFNRANAAEAQRDALADALRRIASPVLIAKSGEAALASLAANEQIARAALAEAGLE